jgi:hypothetical protein
MSFAYLIAKLKYANGKWMFINISFHVENFINNRDAFGDFRIGP